MRSIINHLIQLQELTLIRDEQRSIKGASADLSELNKNIESLYSEYTLFCNEDNEMNRIYVIFSPNKFSRPIDNTATNYDMPAMLTFEAFQSWLAKSRKQDSDMCIKIQDIIIKK